MAIGKKTDNEEYIMRPNGDEIAVGKLTEEEAKDMIRQVIREQRMIQEHMRKMMGQVMVHLVEAGELPEGMVEAFQPNQNKNLH